MGETPTELLGNGAISADERFAAQTKRVTIQPLHDTIQQEIADNDDLTGRYVALDQTIGNAPSEREDTETIVAVPQTPEVFNSANIDKKHDALEPSIQSVRHKQALVVSILVSVLLGAIVIMALAAKMR